MNDNAVFDKKMAACLHGDEPCSNMYLRVSTSFWVHIHFKAGYTNPSSTETGLLKGY